MAAAAAPPSKLVIAAEVEVDEDEDVDAGGTTTILDVAAAEVELKSKPKIRNGKGAKFVLQIVEACAAAATTTCITFNGLKLFEQASAELAAAGMKKEARTIANFAISAQHTDVAFDFSTDNGYDVPWESLGDVAQNATSAETAAAALAEIAARAESSGVLMRRTVAGKLHPWPLPGGSSATHPQFRSVPVAAAACAAYPPDQSWMTHDITNPLDALEWTKTTHMR